MTANTGRTTNKWTDFQMKDSGGTLRSIPVDSINGIGLDYDIVDLTAFMDSLHGALPAQANCVLTIAGPFDTTAVASAGTLSGSHTVLYNLPGGVTPLTVNIQIGIRHSWTSGEPTFGISSTATSGFLVKNYKPDGNGKYTAELYVIAGSTAPAWATAAYT